MRDIRFREINYFYYPVIFEYDLETIDELYQLLLETLPTKA